MKNNILIIAAIAFVISLTSCSTSEHCWAYKDIKSVKPIHSKPKQMVGRYHKPAKPRGLKSSSCYSFN